MTPKYSCSATLVGFVSVDWHKSGLNCKKTKSLVFARLGPHQKISIFWSSLQRQGPYRHFLCGKIICTVFGLSSMAFWMDAIGFPDLRESLFPPLKQHHNDVTGACNLPQKMLECLLDPMVPSLTFYPISFRSYGLS